MAFRLYNGSFPLVPGLGPRIIPKTTFGRETAEIEIVKLLFFFTGRVVLLYVILIFSWPGWSQAYGDYFRAMGNFVFNRESNFRVVFSQNREMGDLRKGDTIVDVRNWNQIDARGIVPTFRLAIESRRIGWIPTALFIALVLASPLSWLRRLRALGLGLVALQFFLLMTLQICIWSESSLHFSQTLSPLNQKWIGLVEDLVVHSYIVWFVPVLLWAVALLQTPDWIVRAAKATPT